jgi:tetratricopeptide (TPR) repeat protein
MSQQPPQWSPQAVQIFTAARQISDSQARVNYVALACGPNTQLRWEVDWLLQWDRAQNAGAGVPAFHHSPTPTSQWANLAVTAYPAPFDTSKSAKPARRGVWIAAIASIILLVIGFLGLFAYGAYIGVTQMGLEREANTIESRAQVSLNQRDYDGAAREYERLVELRKRQYGEKHSKVSETIAGAASCWYWARDYEKAAKLYEQAYQLDLKRVGPKDKKTLANQEYWAIAVRESDNYIRAMEIFNQALAIRKDANGPSHTETAESMLNVAYCQQAMGQSAVALQSYEPAYETITKKYTLFTQNSIETLDAILGCYDDLGRYDDSRKLLTMVYDGLKRAQGIDGPLTPKVRDLLTARLNKDKEWETSLKLEQEVVDDRRARLGDDQPETLSAKAVLAEVLIQLGQTDKGISLLLECRDKWKVAQGDQGEDFINCLHDLADAYKTAKTPEKGIEQFQALLEERKQKLGPRSPATLEAAAQMGWRKIRADNVSAGEADMERALAEAIEAIGLQHETTQSIASGLAEHYCAARMFAKEVEIRRKVAQQQQKTAGIEDPMTRQLLDAQADAELESGNPEVAIDIYRRLFDFETNRSGPTSGYTLSQARALIRSYMRTNQRQKAIDLCDELLAKLRRSTQVDYASSWNAADLGMLLSRMDDPARACDAFEFATATHPLFGYDSEPDFERKVGLWPVQSAAAKLSDRAAIKINTKLETIAKLAGADFFLARALRMQLALQAEAAGKLSEAEKELRELESQVRGNSIGWHSQSLLELGAFLRRQGKLDEAESTLRKALEIKQTIEKRDVEPDPDMRISTASDVQFELALTTIAQTRLAEAETLLLAINDAKSKLTYRQEKFWDVRCRAQAIRRLIEVQTKLGKAEGIENWNSILHGLEATYPGATKV